MKNIKARYFFILAGITLALAIGTVFLIPILNGNWTYFFIALLIIFFIITTFAVQLGTRNIFIAKNQKKIYNTISFESDANFKEELENDGFKSSTYKFGFVLKKIVDKKLYKVVLVNNNEEYFKFDEKENDNLNVSSCKLLIGIEVFYFEDENVVKKAPDYSLDLSNIYYTSFIKGEDNKYVIPDYVESKNHKEDFDYLLNILKLEKK
jgi:hypothetical protein